MKSSFEMSLNILTIPEELLFRIISSLDAASLARCATTCKRIYEVLNNSSALRYIIELHLNGVTDSGNRSLSYADLVEHLQRRRWAWIAPKWRLKLTWKMVDYNLPYEFIGGTFVRQSSSHLEVSTIRTDLPTHNFSVQTTKRALKREFVGRGSLFAIDPSQDLIVIVEKNATPIPPTETRIIRLHIRTMSSDDPHQLAHQPYLQFKVPPNGESNDIHRTHFQIARNMLLIRFLTARQVWIDAKQQRVLIWDWTTSTLILDSSLNIPSDDILQSVNSESKLLDSTYFFAVSGFNSGCIHLYKLAGSPTSPPIHLASLHLPPIRSGCQIASQIYTQAGPIEVKSSLHKYFAVNDDNRIHAFLIDYAQTLLGERLFPVNLYVHQRVFTRYCAKYSKNGGPPLDVPWNEWGPSNSRIVFPSCSQMEREGYVHGERALCPGPKSYDGTAFGTIQNDQVDSLSILDFSIASILSAQGVFPLGLRPGSDDEFKDISGSLVPPTKILRSQLHLYEEDIETRLPCVSCNVGIQRPYDTYLIDADIFVGVFTDFETHSRAVEVYTF